MHDANIAARWTTTNPTQEHNPTMSDTDSKIRKMMADMPNAFNPAKATGVDALIQYNLTSDGGSGSVWNSRIANGEITIEEGEADNPTMTITMDADDYVEMMSGRLDAMQAFMSGKIKVTGDIMLASRLMSFFG
ncbi:MAG: SCP2 sterol-binding domain-containing protein [Chloroflexi bacterium]|nr:SCP2 sterol-binding domain-containing protein [Chloroflexota bacterium]